ncbi:sialidase family protein [Kineococcus arenarius]|uniref:sialidase family protein n=1 Tax=Kineococcus sp. SYSU DK007 TaxID=3383128 RepID=UPI003D7D6AAC
MTTPPAPPVPAPALPPLPDPARSTVAVPAPARGPQRWAGAPCAVLDDDGSVLLAHRERADGDTLVLSRSTDGGATFSEIGRAGPQRAGASVLERPALVRHPGGWRARVCCHDLEVPGEEDRMSTAFLTSRDGWEWTWRGTALRGRPGRWDARGARVTTVLPGGALAYDGRASKEENWFERTGVARPAPGGGWVADPAVPVVDVRYLEHLVLPDGSGRWFFESRTPEGDHELRTQPAARAAREAG